MITFRIIRPEALLPKFTAYDGKTPFRVSQISTFDCEVLQGCRTHAPSGFPRLLDHNSPCVIVHVTNAITFEVGDRIEEMRHYILEQGDAYSDEPLLAPEQDVMVMFHDEFEMNRQYWRGK